MNKAGRGENAGDLKGPGTSALPRGGDVRFRSSSERKQTQNALPQERNKQNLFLAGAPPAGMESLPGPLPGDSYSLAPLRPLPEPSRDRRTVQARAGAAPGPFAQHKRQLMHRCSFHRVTWGRGGYTAETGTLLSLSPLATPGFSLRVHLLCGARSVGSHSGPLAAPLTATMPPSALRSAVTLPRPPAAPHATSARWSLQRGCARGWARRARPLGQLPPQNRRRGGSISRVQPINARVPAPRQAAARTGR